MKTISVIVIWFLLSLGLNLNGIFVTEPDKPPLAFLFSGIGLPLLFGFSYFFSPAVRKIVLTYDFRLLTATWDFFLPELPEHDAVAGKTVQYQPPHSHPVLVNLLVPDFHTPEDKETMLLTTVTSISKHAKIPVSNLFINCQQAHAGKMFDADEIVYW